jgi:tRNA(Ile)-lysidine synthase
LRYDWLTGLAREQRFDAVATAHTADDQAETVLMKFLRGASTRGLAGIHPVLEQASFRIVRPLLETKRAEVEQYLASIAQPWREDHTNFDTQHTRNRIRHELLPLLERDYNPNLRQILSETAEIARDEEDYWRDSTSTLASHWHQRERSLRLQEGGSEFLISVIAVQRRTLRHFLAWHDITVDFHHVEAVRRCALGDGSTANLPGGWQARRNGDWLELFAATSSFEKQKAAQPWHYLLSIPGSCRIPEAGITLQAVLLSEAAASQESPGSLLRASELGSKLTLRNWQPGDRFRPAHTASEEKLKRLFSEKRIPADQRPLWPVALSGSQIVWVRGFPMAHDFAWVPGSGDAVRIDVSPAQ